MKKFRFLGLIPALLVLSIVFTACGGMPVGGSGSGSFALTAAISSAESNVSADLYVDVNVNVDVTPGKYYVDPQVLAGFQAAIAAAKASNESSTDDAEMQATATALVKATAQFLVQRISLDSEETIRKSLKAAVDFANTAISAFEASAGGIEGFDVALLDGVKHSITVAGSVSADENASVSDLISTSIVFVNETINFVSSIVFKAPLYGAIYLANVDRDTVVSSITDGKDVKPSKDWVTPQDLLTFEQAIAKAQEAYDTPGELQQFYNNAKDALNTAKAAFDAAKQKGTQDNSVDRTALAESITIATNLRAGVIVAADGNLVSPSAQWATSADVAALTAAINAARSAYYTLSSKQADLDTAKASLDAAAGAFKPQYGTKSNAPNFSPLQIALNAAIALRLDYTPSGDGYVNANTGYSITTDQYNALTTAISDAQAIINNAASTTAQITGAVKALSTATFSFKVSITISVKVN
ncbi:hypothetical protein ACYULU_11185 [Breznakiellaceae bacterium SP9]